MATSLDSSIVYLHQKRCCRLWLLCCRTPLWAVGADRRWLERLCRLSSIPTASQPVYTAVCRLLVPQLFHLISLPSLFSPQPWNTQDAIEITSELHMSLSQSTQRPLRTSFTLPPYPVKPRTKFRLLSEILSPLLHCYCSTKSFFAFGSSRERSEDIFCLL